MRRVMTALACNLLAFLVAAPTAASGAGTADGPSSVANHVTHSSAAAAAPSGVRHLSSVWDHVESETLLTWYPPASDGGAPVASFEVFLDGRSLGSIEADPDLGDYDTQGVGITGMSAGPHQLGVSAEDATGAVGPVVAVPVVVGGPPANDALAAAQLLDGPWGTVWGTTWRATAEPNDPPPPDEWPGFGGASVWFTWTAPYSARVYVQADSHDSGADPSLAVYSGAGAEALTPVPGAEFGSWSYRSRLYFRAIGGRTYLLAADGAPSSAGGRGRFALSWEMFEPLLPTTTTVTATRDGRSVSLEARVASETGTPGGTIVFRDAGAEIGAGPVVEGVTRVTLPDVARGPHLYTASFVSEGPHDDSTSALVEVLVPPATTQTALGAHATGRRVTLTVTVSGNEGVTEGAVQVTDLGTPVGSIRLVDGAGTITLPAVSPGDHAYRGTFEPDDPDSYSSSTSEIAQLKVEATPTTTVLEATVRPDRIELVALVGAGEEVATGTIKLYDGRTLVATKPVVGGRAAFVVENPIPGTHLYRALFAPTISGQAASASALRSVTISAPRPVRSRTVVTAPRTAVVGARPVVSIRVTGGSSTGPGSLLLRYGTKRITLSLRAGIASFKLPRLKAGTLRLTASYAGNATTLPSSASAAITVKKKR